MLNYIVVNISF